MGFVAGMSQLRKLRRWPGQQLEHSAQGCGSVFQQPGESPQSLGMRRDLTAGTDAKTELEPGRSGLLSQLQHLYLPKQHRGLQRVKKTKRLFVEPEEHGFPLFVLILLHVLSLLRPCGFGAAPQRLPVIRIPWIAAASLLPAGLSLSSALTAAPAPRRGPP